METKMSPDSSVLFISLLRPLDEAAACCMLQMQMQIYPSIFQLLMQTVKTLIYLQVLYFMIVHLYDF